MRIATALANDFEFGAPTIDDADFHNIFVSKVRSPEHALMVAVIYRAVLDMTPDLTSGNAETIKTKRDIRDEAYDWIFSDDSDEDEPFFSFQQICDYLGLDMVAAREFLSRKDLRIQLEFMRINSI